MPPAVSVGSSTHLSSKIYQLERMTRTSTAARVDPRDNGGAPARHGVVQVSNYDRAKSAIDTATQVASLASGVYNVGKAVMPYVRPALTAMAAVA